MLRKFASFDVLEATLAPEGGSALRAYAHRHSFTYDPRPGYLYVRSRAISSRTNDNFDTFPAEEIKASYLSFIGKPVFVNHHNDNHRRARGVIIDAVLHEDRNPDGSPDTWSEVLMEVDAVRFPKLAKAILAGHIDRTSMGTDVAYSLCSFCGNKATTPLEYCAHIPKLKGKRIHRTTASGHKEAVLVSEICHGLKFFENSLLVEEPADPTAFFTGVEDHSGHRTASKTAMPAGRGIGSAEDPEGPCICGGGGHSWIDHHEWNAKQPVVKQPYNLKPCDCPGAKKIEPHTNGQHSDFAQKHHAEGRTDAWGHPLMQAYDGHGAWSCNNYNCVEHPQSMYEQKPGQAPGWMQAEHDPHKDLTREVGKAFHEQGHAEDGRFLLDQNHEGPSKYSAKSKEYEPPTVSGVALRAADTGRIFMIQRSNKDEKDPARGTWEFPGGHHEEGDKTSLHAGIREWEEEVGHKFPEGGVVSHTWRTGPYQGHMVVVPKEHEALDLSKGRRTVNPDDPDKDDHEQSAWWDPEHAKKNPALRQECKDNWKHIVPGLKDATAGAYAGPKQPRILGHEIGWDTPYSKPGGPYQGRCSCGAQFEPRGHHHDAYADAMEHIGPSNPDYDLEDMQRRMLEAQGPPPKKKAVYLQVEAVERKRIADMSPEELKAFRGAQAKGKKWNADNAPHADNIIEHWNACTPHERSSGMNWYQDAHHLTKHIAKDTGHPMHVAAGLMSNYSPQTHWASNMMNAARAMRLRTGVGGKGNEHGILATDRQKKAASRLMGTDGHEQEHYDTVLGGPKTHAFAHLIHHGGNKDPNDPKVVIDRHALSVACGSRASDHAYEQSGLGGKKRYKQVADEYHKAAQHISQHTGVKVEAHQVQAATWLCRQRLNSAQDKDGTEKISNDKTAQWNEYAGEHHPEAMGKEPGTGYSAPKDAPEDVVHANELHAEGKLGPLHTTVPGTDKRRKPRLFGRTAVHSDALDSRTSCPDCHSPGVRHDVVSGVSQCTNCARKYVHDENPQAPSREFQPNHDGPLGPDEGHLMERQVHHTYTDGGLGKEFDPHSHPLTPRLRQSLNSVYLAYGETRAPEDVDTLRDEECPVCGESDAYDGNRCDVCGFDAPPKMFQDPDLDMAKQLDLRKDIQQDEFSDPNGDGMPDVIPGSGQPGPDAIPPNAGAVPDPDDVAQQQVNEIVEGQQPLQPEQLDANGQPVANANPMEQGLPMDPNALPMDPSDIAGQQPVDEYGQAEPGTPADGIPDMVCPACGYQEDGAQPLSTDMDSATNPAEGVGALCPNCQQAPLMSAQDMADQTGVSPVQVRAHLDLAFPTFVLSE